MIYLDQNKIVIKQYEKIILLETNCIILSMKNNLLKLYGTNFLVLYLSKEEIHIKGKIKEVKFDE